MADYLPWLFVIGAALAVVADALNEAGVDWRLLKGLATSHLLYPEQSWRTTQDVDLLVFERRIAKQPCVQNENIKLSKCLDRDLDRARNLVLVCKVLWSGNRPRTKFGHQCVESVLVLP